MIVISVLNPLKFFVKNWTHILNFLIYYELNKSFIKFVSYHFTEVH